MLKSLDFKKIFIACLIISIGQLSMGLVFPSLPWIAQDFNISLEQTQLLVSAYMFGFGPSQFIYGPLSDSLGRKKVLLFGLIISLFGLGIIIMFDHIFAVVVLGRFIQGIGTGGCAVLARASVRDNFNGSQLPLAMSYIAMVASITPLLAPIIGGFINFHFGWSMVFISLFSYVLICWGLIAIKFKESLAKTKAIPSPLAIAKQYGVLLRSTYFMSFASISWLNFTLMITTVSIMPFIMQVQIGMTSDQYALWSLIPALGMLIGTTLSNRIRSRIGDKKLLQITPVLHFLSAIWLFFTPLDPLMLMLGQLLLIIGNALALPCAFSLVMQPYKENAGAAAALSGGGQMIVSSIVSVLLVQLGVEQAWHLSFVIVVFAFITYLNINRGFKATP
jgi:Bcr/CflA subfamily drug resistance transporter